MTEASRTRHVAFRLLLRSHLRIVFVCLASPSLCLTLVLWFRLMGFRATTYAWAST